MTEKKRKEPVPSINIRIHPELKDALDKYCDEHIEKIAEAVTSAIKHYIGFGKPPIQKPLLKVETADSKPLRLDIRVHPRLKTALQEYCTNRSESITDVVSTAIMTYIGFNE